MFLSRFADPHSSGNRRCATVYLRPRRAVVLALPFCLPPLLPAAPPTGTAAEVQLRVSTRDDVDDAEYVRLGAPYQAVGAVRIGNRACTATLVRTTDGVPRVITAAHCVDRNFDNLPDIAAASVTFETGSTLEGTSVAAVDIQVQEWNSSGGFDLAIIALAEFPPGTAPIPMTVSAAMPAGEEVVMVGFGSHGNGLPPFENLVDDQRRAATNTADQFFAAGADAGQIRIDFDHPADPSLSTMGASLPTAFEGTSGVGDSGAPLLHHNQIIGILHGGINPTGNSYSEYGDVSIFAGVFHPRNTAFLRANHILVAGIGTPAATVTVDAIAQPGQPFIATGSSQPARDGSIVQIGTFPAGFDPTVASPDLMAIARAWLPFGETATRVIAGEPGRFSGSSTTDGSAFAGKKIYWWILQTTGGTPAPDLSNVSHWGLFTSSSDRWQFPALGLPPPNNTTLINSSEVDQAAPGSTILDDRLVLETITDRVSDYAAWSDTAFDASVNAGSRAPGADPDGDGHANGIEWILGTSPLVPNPASPLSTQVTTGTVVIRHTRRRSLPDGSHHFESSINLSHWEPMAALTTAVEESDPDKEWVKVIFPATSPMRYWRLVATTQQ